MPHIDPRKQLTIQTGYGVAFMTASNGFKAENTVIVGLDALSSRVLDEALDRGYMPYLAPLLKSKRTSYRDMPCIPPVTIASWPSIMSGVNPGKHGMYTFTRFTRDPHTGEERREVYSTFWLEHPRIHEMASFHDSRIKSFIMNPIPDRPIIPVKGATIINNMFFKTELSKYPENIDSKLLGILEEGQKLINAYETSPACNVIPRFNRVVGDFLIPLAEEITRRDYRIVWLTIDFPDHVFHICEKSIREWRIDMLSKTFNLIDKFIKILFESFQLKTIVSDHGFMPYNKLLSINDILLKHGYAVESKEPILDLGGDVPEKNILRVPSKLVRLAKTLRISKPAKKILRKIKGGEIQVLTYKKTVDPYKSKAYYMRMAYGVFFNDPSIREKVRDILTSYTDLIDLYYAEEVYSGPYVNRGPGLVTIPKDGVNLGSIELKGKDILDTRGGDHHRNGILIVVDGPGPLPENPPNHLVAPLIMCGMGIPVSHMTDDLGMLEGLGLVCRKKNYVIKWRIAKKLARKKIEK